MQHLEEEVLRVVVADNGREAVPMAVARVPVPPRPAAGEPDPQAEEAASVSAAMPGCCSTARGPASCTAEAFLAEAVLQPPQSPQKL